MNTKLSMATGGQESDTNQVGRDWAVGRIVLLKETGDVMVALESGFTLACDVLISSQGGALQLNAGDKVLVCIPASSGKAGRGIVLGTVAKYRPDEIVASVTIKATELLKLQCGEASLDLRADGKLMIRGEEVLTRAKKTHRIKAGSVDIN
ncbi:MAG: hypothetical protein HGA75_09445 [Thiobacillus sp.]|nr:hypothetical protein [Thiobacillus sp.]